MGHESVLCGVFYRVDKGASSECFHAFSVLRAGSSSPLPLITPLLRENIFCELDLSSLCLRIPIVVLSLHLSTFSSTFSTFIVVLSSSGCLPLPLEYCSLFSGGTQCQLQTHIYSPAIIREKLVVQRQQAAKWTNASSFVP